MNDNDGLKKNETTFVELNLNLNEVNLVLAALQEMPHRVVHALVTNIMEQANKQIKQEEVS